MTRREFLAAAGLAALKGPPHTSVVARAFQAREPDIRLHIAETTLDIGPRKSVRTLAYNGQVPGPLLRARSGQRVVVDVFNDNRDQDIVHWHGFHIPPEVDGA